MPSRQPDAPSSAFPELSTAVGSRIKALRTERGISLSSLARTTGLGKGTLSELERGQRNPTLDTLFAIATALSVPLSDLLLPHEEGAVSEAAPAHGQNVDARLVGRWLEPTELVEVYRMAVGPGRRQSRSHSAGVVETITVLEGRVDVGPNAAPVRLASGQSHTFAADQDHLYEGLVPHSSVVLIMRYPIPYHPSDGS